MAAQAQYRTQHVATAPPGWKVRSKMSGEHVIVLAFPPGKRKRGSGKLLEILHPEGENPRRCNPGELLIFGNPARRRNAEGQYTRTGRKRTEEHKAWLAVQGLEGKLAIWEAQLRSSESQRPPDLAEAERAKRKIAQTQHALSAARERLRAAQEARLSGRSNPRRANPRRKRADRSVRRRNPSETQQAVKLYQSFHGKDPKEISERQESAAMRLEYTCLGALDYILFRTPLGDDARLNFEGDGVKLASSPNGQQLYCIGGNQNILPLLDSASQEKDFIDLGDALEVQYVARKIHGKFEPVAYFHKFGEDTGSLPRLFFDKLKKRIFFTGGDYHIDASNGVSPGIVN